MRIFERLPASNLFNSGCPGWLPGGCNFAGILTDSQENPQHTQEIATAASFRT